MYVQHLHKSLETLVLKLVWQAVCPWSYFPPTSLKYLPLVKLYTMLFVSFDLLAFPETSVFQALVQAGKG